jgi:hypothetical protein
LLLYLCLIQPESLVSVDKCALGGAYWSVKW